MDTEMFIAKEPKELYDNEAKPLKLSKVAEAFAFTVHEETGPVGYIVRVAARFT